MALHPIQGGVGIVRGGGGGPCGSQGLCAPILSYFAYLVVLVLNKILASYNFILYQPCTLKYSK